MSQSLVFVGGGDGFDTYEEYLESLRDKPWVVAPYEGEKKRWRQPIAEKYRTRMDVYIPELPCKQNAKYIEWKIVFDQLAVKLDEDAVLVGHSLGANFLVKYFYETGKKAKTVHLIAGCYGLGGGFELPDDLSRLHEQVGMIHLWQSTDDPIVTFADYQQYRVSLPNAIPHVFDNRKHFNMESFPELEEYLQEDLEGE